MASFSGPVKVDDSSTLANRQRSSDAIVFEFGACKKVFECARDKLVSLERVCAFVLPGGGECVSDPLRETRLSSPCRLHNNVLAAQLSLLLTLPNVPYHKRKGYT
jgi:hypothetical protein